MRTTHLIATVAALLAPVVVVPAGVATASDDAALTTYISEIHYDNVGTDTGEAIEVTGPAGTDLTGWSLVLYNGSDAETYGSASVLDGVLADQGAGVGTFVVDFPSNGIQNGAPDAVALLDASGVVQQFISYEGSLTAVGGPADGLLSTDIGAAEDGDTLVGQSLQRGPDGTWVGPLCASFGTPNDPAAPAECPVEARITEIHYDNAGVDVGEAIEIEAPADADLSGWSVVRYNGSNGLVYGTDALSGTVTDLGGGVGTYVIDYPTDGLQNGPPDGVALVGPDGVAEFLSYEGSFTALDGPAAGLSSVDIGVAEGSTTPIGTSLQLAAGGWSGPKCASFGGLNDPAAPVECPAPLTIFVSELHYENTGTDVNEGVEVEGPAGTDLAGWRIELYNGNGGGVYDTIDLSGVIPDLADGIGVLAFPIAGIQNGAPDAIALVDPDGAVVELLGYEGTMTATDGAAVGSTSVDIGVAEGDSTLADQSLQRVGGAWAGPRCASFGELNDPFATDACPVEVRIHDVQGPGSTSPLVGARVIVEGVVVGDHEGPSPTLRGFFVQEEDADVDADPSTSEGVFVFNVDDDEVSTGDLVRIEATVEERFGNTQLAFADIAVLSPGNPLPSSATVTFPLAATTDLEAVEGMLATFADTLVVSEYFDYDRYGEIVVAKPAVGLGADRVMNPTAVYAPTDPRAQELRDTNLLSRITIDDGFTNQNPSTVIHPINREPFTLENSFRGGDAVTGLTGPVYYSVGRYSVLPLGDLDGDGTNEGYGDYERSRRPTAPEDLGGDLRVATLNALNYFVSLDTADTCGPTQDQDCRGADDRQEFERQHAKLMNALVGLDADVVGLVEIENTTGVEALATIVDGEEGGLPGLNDLLGDGTYAYVAAGVDSVVGTDAIKVGVIYRPAAVSPFGAPAVLDTPAFLDPLGTGSDRNRAAVAQSFVESSSGEVFSVVVNHLKSKGSACGEPGEGGLTGNCDQTRTAAATVLADWIASDPTGSGDDDWLILGDLNAYDQEAPIATLENAGYVDEIGRWQGEFAYSFVFDGEVGYLDHVLSSATMTAQVTGATEWHINADEPDLLDYDTTFKSDTQDALFDPTTPFRASDHDAALVGLSLASLDVRLVAPIPFVLWPVNGKLRHVELVAWVDRMLTDDVVALAATSSEADSGLARRDRPGDVVVEDDELQLRAEAFGRWGRTYTVTAAVQVGGQTVVVDDVLVFVPRPGFGGGPLGRR